MFTNTLGKTTGARSVKKTEIIYTRVNKPNLNYICKLAKASKTSRATCLDEVFNYMRENMDDSFIVKQIAKRRDQISEAV